MVAVWCGCAVLCFPAVSAAQKDVFVQGLLQLNAAVAGTYGDEGAQILPAIDTMARGLAEWDRSIAAFEARVAAGTTSASPEETVRTRLALARLYVERRRLNEAIREIDAVSPLAANPADLHLLRALALDASGKSAAAGEAFLAAWNLDRDDPVKAYHVLQRSLSESGASSAEAGQRAMDALSRAYQQVAQTGKRPTAVTFAHAGLFDDRSAGMASIPHAIYAEAYKYIADGAYELAIAQFRRAAADDPLTADPAARAPLIARAGEALRAKRVAEARGHLHAALSMAPGSSEARRMLGLADWLDGQDEASIQHLEAAVRANTRDERSRLALARVFANAGRDDDAERTLQETMRAIPGSMLARWWLAADYERLNRIADARRVLVLADSPAALDGAVAMSAFVGRLARHAGDSSGAIDALTRGVNARPNDPGAHLDLAEVYLDQDRLDEAFRELVAALLLDPQNARAHAAIGRIQLARGRPGEAAVALSRAIALMPGDHEFRYALAMALKQLGRDEEAAREIEAFQRAQQQAIADRRAQIARDVLREAAKLTGSDSTPTAKGAGR